MNFSALYTILVTLGPVTLEFTLLTTSVAIRQKSSYHAAKYLRMSWTFLDLLYRFGRRIGVDDYPDIRLVVAHGMLLWQPVKFGKCLQTLRGTTFALCSGVLQRIGCF